MLKGDLTTTPLAPLLLELAADSATGCLIVTADDGDEGLVYLKNGLVYAVSVPGERPQLGAKLVSSGALAPEALAEALEAQQSELQGWRLGELLVHLGYVEQPVVAAFVTEQINEALWDLMRWSRGRWKFRKNAKTRQDVARPRPVVDLLEALRDRGSQWETISAVIHGPAAVPRLAANGNAAAETTLDNDAWSMLCKIDGERSVTELARDCGYTLFEAGHVILSLVEAGLVEIEEQADPEGAELYGASALSSALSGVLDAVDEAPVEAAAEDDDALSRIARLVSEVASTPTGNGGGDHNGDGSAPALTPPQRVAAGDDVYTMMVPVHRHSTESFAASMARVSTALSDVLGPMPEIGEDIDPLIETRPVHRRRSGDPEWEHRRRLRSAAAAELASAQELAEALRPDRDLSGVELPGEQPPRLVDLETERARVAALQAESLARLKAEDAERHAAEAAARAAAEQFAKAAAEEAERLAAEQAERAARDEAERVARAEAERLAAEQAAAEAAAREEAERLAAEQAAAEAAAREEAERLAAEQAAAEAAAREEAERLAAEAKAERAARRKAEKEAAEAAARKADEAAAATAMLIELNASASDAAEAASTTPETAEPDPEPAPAPAAEPGPDADSGVPEIADTAALLRELSSLTVEEEDERRLKPPAAPNRPRPAANDTKKPKKKMGLFGR